MRKIILFYLLCSLSTILIWLAIDDYDIESPDFKFGFNVLMLATCAVYAPICTIVASILYFSKVNKAILSNRLFGILYCIFPFLCFKALDIICNHTGSLFGYSIEYSISIVFVLQNVIIVLAKYIKRRDG